MSKQPWDTIALVACFGLPMLVAIWVNGDGRTAGDGIDILIGAALYAAYFWIFRPRL